MKSELNKFSYTHFKEDITTTIQFSGVITALFLIIYALFAWILTAVGDVSSLNFIGIILLLLFISLTLGLIQPFIYSFYALTGVLHTADSDKVSLKSFFKTYLIGSRAPFSGQLNIWSTLLKAVLFYILIGVVSSLCLSLAASVEGSELNLFYSELAPFIQGSNTNLNELNALFSKYSSLVYQIKIYTNFPGLILSTYYLLHTICLNTFRYRFAPMINNAPPRYVGAIFRQVIKRNRKDYYKMYYSLLYPYTILYFVSFSLTYFLLAFLGPANLDINILSLTSIIVSFIVLLPFLPLLFNFDEYIFNDYSRKFMGVFIEVLTKQLNMQKMNANLRDQYEKNQTEEVQKNLDRLKDLYNSLDDELNKDVPSSQRTRVKIPSDKDILESLKDQDDTDEELKKKMEDLEKKRALSDEELNKKDDKKDDEKDSKK